jgi:hypothetical protein
MRLGPGWLPGDEKLNIPDDWSLTEHRMAIPDALARCPYCDGVAVESQGRATTLMAKPYGGGPMDDSNHVTEQRHCMMCNRKWYREWVASSRTVWLSSLTYVGPSSLKYVVLAGTPGCCRARYGTDTGAEQTSHTVHHDINLVIEESVGMAVANLKSILKVVSE